MPYSPAGSLPTYGLIDAGTAVANNAWIGYDPGFTYGTSVIYEQQIMGTYTTAATANYIPTSYQTFQTFQTVAYNAYYNNWPCEPETPEQTAARLEQMAKWEEEQKKISARARELLEATLNDEQREQLKKESFFDLETSSGRLYRIKPGRKVERLDPVTKKATSLFCIHPDQSLPADDIAVSQKMWLETDEETFLKTANETKLAA